MDRPAHPTVVLALGLLTACAGAGPAPSPDDPLGLPESFSNTYRVDPVVHRAEISTSLGVVTAAVPRVYEALGLPAEEASGTGVRTFSTPNLRIQGRLYEGERNSEYFSCGSSMSGERADLYELEFVVVTRLREAGPGTTEAETIVGARARDRYAGTSPVPCRSTGKLEEAILRRLRGSAAGL